MMNMIVDCDILTAEEYVKLQENISYINTTWAVSFECPNRINFSWINSERCPWVGAIRPCLRMDDCDVKIGTKVIWFGVSWTHIGDGILLCDYITDFVDTNITYGELHEKLRQWWKRPTIDYNDEDII